MKPSPSLHQLLFNVLRLSSLFPSSLRRGRSIRCSLAQEAVFSSFLIGSRTPCATIFIVGLKVLARSERECGWNEEQNALRLQLVLMRVGYPRATLKHLPRFLALGELLRVCAVSVDSCQLSQRTVPTFSLSLNFDGPAFEPCHPSG